MTTKQEQFSGTQAVREQHRFDEARLADWMQANVEGYALRFDGLNTADGDKKVVVTIPKVDIDPAKALELIQDEFGKLDVDFTILSTPSAAPFTITMET